jgi:hypothetical protein
MGNSDEFCRAISDIGERLWALQLIASHQSLSRMASIALFVLPLLQPDPWASAVLVDEFDPSSL